MKKLSFKEVVLPSIILFFICLVTASLLALTNQLTKPKIEALAAANADTARKKVLIAAESFGDPLEIDFEEQTYTYFEGFGKDTETSIGYVFTTVTKGYGGDVKLMTGISKDGKVSGIEVLELSETPGLGMKAYDDFFLKQFLGKGDCISVVKKDADDNSVCAITGATITSDAVADAVNIALELYKSLAGGTLDG